MGSFPQDRSASENHNSAGRNRAAALADDYPLLLNLRDRFLLLRQVAITGNEAKSPQFPRVQQIHRVDDERAVTGIFADCITELLDRLDRMFEQHCAPAMQV